MKIQTSYIFLSMAALFGTGCAHPAIVRQTASRLGVEVAKDEQLVDENIAAQQKFYTQQSALIENSRAEGVKNGMEAFRRMRSATAASNMSREPEKEARLANLMDYLLDLHEQEYQLWQRLCGGDQRAREELESKIAKLERQKKLLQQVRDNLNQLSLARKGRTQALLKFSEDAYAAYKKANP
jgi:hypothetical protein